MEDREDLDGDGKADPGEERPGGIQSAGVGIGEERTPARDGRVPDGEAAARVRVVDNGLDGKVVAEEVPSPEVMAKEERIREDHQQEKKEEPARAHRSQARARRERGSAQDVIGSFKAKLG